MTLKAGETYHIPFTIHSTALLAGTSIEIVSPVSGVIEEALVIVQEDVTTGGAITFKIGTTDVLGLSLTVADAATKGTIVTDTSTEGSTTRVVAKGGRIQVVPAAAFATAGAVNGYIIVKSADPSKAVQY